MAFIKRFLDFYINSSIHVALAVLSFCFLTAFELDLKLSIYFYISVFCASVSGYNFVKYFGLAKFYYRSLTTKLKYIQTVSLLSGIGFLYAFFMLRTPSQLLLIFLGFITFLYAIPLGIKTPRNLRSIGGVKIYIIAIVWGGDFCYFTSFRSSKHIGIRPSFDFVSAYIYTYCFNASF
ncbi:hypothetical protein N9S93_01550 [Flavobacteriaceae bacterium]|nr:hypothetical protein [Flavobacteriaceae bacterium]